MKILIKEIEDCVKHLHTVRVQVPINASRDINLNSLSEKLPGNFSNQEQPNKFITFLPKFEEHKIMITRKFVTITTKPSIWDKIKGDFKQFLNDIEWEKFVVEDLKGIRRDIRKIKGGVQ